MAGRRILYRLPIDSAFGRSILAGLGEFAKRSRWEVVVDAWTPVTDRGLELGIDGAVVGRQSPAQLRALDAAGIRVVHVGAQSGAADAPRVGIDEEAVGRLALEHLLAGGRRTFAYWAGTRESVSTTLRGRAFARAVAGIHGDCRWGHAEPGAPGSRRRRLLRWLERLPRPLAVFAPTDLLGYEILAALRDLGLRVPDDAMVLGVDDDPLVCDIAQPALSSVRLPAERLGEAAGETLAVLLAGRRPPIRPLLLPPLGVVTRASTLGDGPEDPEVQSVLRRIHHGGDVTIDPGSLAELAGISRRTLERRFGEAMGTSVSAYLRRLRVRRAQTILIEDDLDLATVARRSGFTSAAELCRVFKREIGCTPGGYRAAAQRGAAAPRQR